MKSAKTSPEKKLVPQVFVQCELDKETKEMVKGWDPKFSATMDGFDRLIEAGYKVSVAQDKYHDCIGVFCTISVTDHPNANLCLTARGPDWKSALKVLVFKHFNILQEHWDTEVNQQRSRDEWG